MRSYTEWLTVGSPNPKGEVTAEKNLHIAPRQEGNLDRSDQKYPSERYTGLLLSPSSVQRVESNKQSQSISSQKYNYEQQLNNIPVKQDNITETSKYLGIAPRLSAETYEKETSCVGKTLSSEKKNLPSISRKISCVCKMSPRPSFKAPIDAAALMTIKGTTKKEEFETTPSNESKPREYQRVSDQLCVNGDSITSGLISPSVVSTTNNSSIFPSSIAATSSLSYYFPHNGFPSGYSFPYTGIRLEKSTRKISRCRNGHTSRPGRSKLMLNEPVNCAMCKRKIENKYLLYALEKYWHEKCLKCDFCRKPLHKFGIRFFFRQGAKFCQDDFMRTFGGRGSCSMCDEVIPATEYVLKFKGDLVYHLECFTCSTCKKRFCVGDAVQINDPKTLTCTVCRPL